MGAGATGFSLILDEDTIATHRRNVESWRQLDEELLVEIQELPKITKFLHGCVQWMKDNGGKSDVAEMHDRVSSFLRTIGARKSLITQRLAVNARWNGLVGVDSVLDAAGAKLKAVETGRAKIQLDVERKEAGVDGPVLIAKKAEPGRIYRKKG